MPGLADHLRRRISRHGPITVAEYMEEALGHPRYGYYMTRDPLGAAGDFTTAPEISQVFGELIGLWCTVVWRSMGAPRRVNLVELGPGRGTLMADALRAARVAPEFRAALHVHLVETSPALRACQAKALAGADLEAAPAWHDTFAQVPEGPLLVIANEFFDALPVRQFLSADEGWRERLVDMDHAAGGFRFVLSEPLPAPPLAPGFTGRPAKGLVEVSPAGLDIAGAVAARVAASGGAALIVDYGYAAGAVGETLQAVKNHAYHDVLSTPGEADLTAHVDFAALAHAIRQAGAAALGPLPQGVFLETLGIARRIESLLAVAREEQTDDIKAAHRRLVGADGMGTLFKVLAIAHDEAMAVAGFE